MLLTVINTMPILISFVLIPSVMMLIFGIRDWDTPVLLCYINFLLHQIFKTFEHKCYICPMSKQTRKSFPKSIKQSKRPFEVVHSDIWGPYHTPSMTCENYFLTLVNDYTRATWTYLMTYKSQTSAVLEKFVNLIQNRFRTSIKTIRIDNGTYFLSHSCQSLFASLGILHRRSCPHTPQQNGVLERKHRHLLQVTRALLFQLVLPTYFLGEALLNAIFLINKLPTKLLSWKTPFEMLYHKQPNYNVIKIFGCLAFSTDVKPHKDKLAPRATACVFLGF